MYEKESKLNPPMERRVKLISDKELTRAVESVSKEAVFFGLDITEAVAKSVRELPLTLHEDAEKNDDY